MDGDAPSARAVGRKKRQLRRHQKLPSNKHSAPAKQGQAGHLLTAISNDTGTPSSLLSVGEDLHVDDQSGTAQQSHSTKVSDRGDVDLPHQISYHGSTEAETELQVSDVPADISADIAQSEGSLKSSTSSSSTSSNVFMSIEKHEFKPQEFEEVFACGDHLAPTPSNPKSNETLSSTKSKHKLDYQLGLVQELKNISLQNLEPFIRRSSWDEPPTGLLLAMATNSRHGLELTERFLSFWPDANRDLICRRIIGMLLTKMADLTTAEYWWQPFEWRMVQCYLKWHPTFTLPQWLVQFNMNAMLTTGCTHPIDELVRHCTDSSLSEEMLAILLATRKNATVQAICSRRPDLHISDLVLADAFLFAFQVDGREHYFHTRYRRHELSMAYREFLKPGTETWSLFTALFKEHEPLMGRQCLLLLLENNAIDAVMLFVLQNGLRFYMDEDLLEKLIGCCSWAIIVMLMQRVRPRDVARLLNRALQVRQDESVRFRNWQPVSEMDMLISHLLSADSLSTFNMDVLNTVASYGKWVHCQLALNLTGDLDPSRSILLAAKCLKNWAQADSREESQFFEVDYFGLLRERLNFTRSQHYDEISEDFWCALLPRLTFHSSSHFHGLMPLMPFEFKLSDGVLNTICARCSAETLEMALKEDQSYVPTSQSLLVIEDPERLKIMIRHFSTELLTKEVILHLLRSGAFDVLNLLWGKLDSDFQLGTNTTEFYDCQKFRLQRQVMHPTKAMLSSIRKVSLLSARSPDRGASSAEKSRHRHENSIQRGQERIQSDIVTLLKNPWEEETEALKLLLQHQNALSGIDINAFARSLPNPEPSWSDDGFGSNMLVRLLIDSLVFKRQFELPRMIRQRFQSLRFTNDDAQVAIARILNGGYRFARWNQDALVDALELLLQFCDEVYLTQLFFDEFSKIRNYTKSEAPAAILWERILMSTQISVEWSLASQVAILSRLDSRELNVVLTHLSEDLIACEATATAGASNFDGLPVLEAVWSIDPSLEMSPRTVGTSLSSHPAVRDFCIQRFQDRDVDDTFLLAAVKGLANRAHREFFLKDPTEDSAYRRRRRRGRRYRDRRKEDKWKEDRREENSLQPVQDSILGVLASNPHVRFTPDALLEIADLRDLSPTLFKEMLAACTEETAVEQCTDQHDTTSLGDAYSLGKLLPEALYFPDRASILTAAKKQSWGVGPDPNWPGYSGKSFSRIAASRDRLSSRRSSDAFQATVGSKQLAKEQCQDADTLVFEVDKELLELRKPTLLIGSGECDIGWIEQGKIDEVLSPLYAPTICESALRHTASRGNAIAFHRLAARAQAQSLVIHDPRALRGAAYKSLNTWIICTVDYLYFSRELHPSSIALGEKRRIVTNSADDPRWMSFSKGEGTSLVDALTDPGTDFDTLAVYRLGQRRQDDYRKFWERVV